MSLSAGKGETKEMLSQRAELPPGRSSVAFTTCFLLIMLVAVAALHPRQLAAQTQRRSIALLEIAEGNEEPDPTRKYALEHLAQVAGFPFVTTADLEAAAEHPVIIAASGLNADNLTRFERQKLSSYVAGGGVLIVPYFNDPGLYQLFGITGNEFSRQRYTLSFDVDGSSKAFSWIDDPMERTISIGDEGQQKAIISRGYTVDQAAVLAAYGDGTPAIMRNQYGKGYAYAFGVSFKDIVIRSQIDRDFSANRSYSNGFEPTTDVFALLVRGMVMEHVPHAVWKHTAPFNSRSVLIVTHDVDSESSMLMMNRFAAFEQEHDITATYFITTHYFSDYLDGDFYTAYRDSIRRLDAQGQRIGSHAVGHFPDFDDLPLGNLVNSPDTYAPRYDGERTAGATILGELEVSRRLLEQDVPQEVVSFRAGYLAYPDKLVNALDTLGYRFNSTYSANDVMGAFPFRNLKSRSFSGAQTGVWEIPVTISDVFTEAPISANNYERKVGIWMNVLRRYADNAAPTVLLIHPNRDFKLEAEQIFIQQLPEGVTTESIASYGTYWQQRAGLDFTTRLEGKRLIIQLKDQRMLPDSLSLVVDEGAKLDEIILQNAQGESLPFVAEEREEAGTVLLYSSKNGSIERPAPASPGRATLFPNTPNPFRSYTTLSYDLPVAADVRLTVYTITGQKVATLVDARQPAGPHQVRFRGEGLSSGIYLYRLQAGLSSQVRKMIVVR